MTDNNIQLNPNPIVRFLGKPMSQITKEDINKGVKEFEIEMIKFRYVANDGKLKTLNFIINSLEHLDDVLTAGERVDGSSLFPFLEAGSSDLYVVPRFRTAFIDPLPRFPPSTCCATTTPTTASPLPWHRNTPSPKPPKLSPKPPEWNSRQWASLNTT